jgi:hypothetical protein
MTTASMPQDWNYGTDRLGGASMALGSGGRGFERYRLLTAVGFQLIIFPMFSQISTGVVPIQHREEVFGNESHWEEGLHSHRGARLRWLHVCREHHLGFVPENLISAWNNQLRF